MDLIVLLQLPAPIPALAHATARSGLTPDETGDLDELPIDSWSQWVSIYGSAPTEVEDEAILTEILRWLEQVPGDWALFHATWTPIAHRRAGRLVLESEYKSLAA